MIDRLKHRGADHPFNIVVGRYDHVIAGIAFAKSRKEFGVVGKEVVSNVDPGGSGEVTQRGLTDIGVPVIDIDLTTLGKAHPVHRRQNRGNGERTLQETPAIGRKATAEERTISRHRENLLVQSRRPSRCAELVDLVGKYLEQGRPHVNAVWR